MSIASKARQDMEQKARYHRTTRVPENERGTLVWDSKQQGTFHRTEPRPQGLCPCGGGKSYKRCHGKQRVEIG